MTPAQITHAFELFGSVIPASTGDTTRPRTAHFYRKAAIEWAHMAREWPPGEVPAVCRRLAKSYLATYRRLKSSKEQAN